MTNNETPPQGRNHTCFKNECYFCYEMNRIKQVKPEYVILTRKQVRHLEYKKYLLNKAS